VRGNENEKPELLRSPVAVWQNGLASLALVQERKLVQGAAKNRRRLGSSFVRRSSGEGIYPSDGERDEGDEDVASEVFFRGAQAAGLSFAVARRELAARKVDAPEKSIAAMGASRIGFGQRPNPDRPAACAPRKKTSQHDGCVPAQDRQRCKANLRL